VGTTCAPPRSPWDESHRPGEAWACGRRLGRCARPCRWRGRRRIPRPQRRFMRLARGQGHRETGEGQDPFLRSSACGLIIAIGVFSVRHSCRERRFFAASRRKILATSWRAARTREPTRSCSQWPSQLNPRPQSCDEITHDTDRQPSLASSLRLDGRVAVVLGGTTAW